MATEAKPKTATSKRAAARTAGSSEAPGPADGGQVTTVAARLPVEIGADSRLLSRLRRKHPDVDPQELAFYLSKPVDEQPLWLNSGMSKEERNRVIADFLTFAKKAKMVPPLRVAGSQADRAVKRQTRLTFKQWQVGRLTVQGLDIKEIASQLKISDRMVKTQLQAIRRKGNLSRNAQIVLWFLGC